MAFFNLTYLGNQDPFRTASGHLVSQSRPPAQPWTEERNGRDNNGEEDERVGGGENAEGKDSGAALSKDTVEGSFGRKSSPIQLGLNDGREAVPTASKMSPDGPTFHSTRLYGFPKSASQPWHHGSHVRYTEMLHKHKRNPKGALGTV